jgi:hypothetical protein
VNDNELEEIMSYNKLVSKLSLADDDDDSKVWKFCHITAHQRLLKPSDKNWKGSKYNVLVEWENGEITSKPLLILAIDGPVTCTIYGRENDLLEFDGWNHFKAIA